MPQAKFLVEFLQEKQEPFSLEDYLVERGYRTPSRITKISAIFGLKKRRHVVKHCSDVVKLVLSQVLEVNGIKRIKNSGNCKGEDGAGDGNVEGERLSSTTRTTTTMSITCSESSDAQDSHCSGGEREEETHCSDVDYACQFKEEADAEWMSKRRTVEDNKQLSPVSVLDQTEPDYTSPLHYKQCSHNPIQGISTCLREWGRPNNIQEQQQLHISDSYSQYITNRMILRQSTELLIDCTREVIENHKKDKRGHLNQLLGTDELWKLVCENVWQWSQDLIDYTNTSILAHTDVAATSEEWNDGPKQQKREISIEIGDAILDEIIHEIAN